MKISNPIFSTFCLITILVISSCGGGSLSSRDDVPLSIPLHMPKGKDVGIALDEEQKVWQWKFDKRDQLEKVEQVPIDDVHSVAIAEGAFAVKNNGELWAWEPGEIKNIEKIDLKKKVKKVVPFGDFDMVLYLDGTLGFLFEDIIGFPTPKTYLGHVNLSAFSNVKDIFLGGGRYDMYILALMENGEVYIAGGQRKGKSGTLIIGSSDFAAEPVKIEGLKNIKRIGKIGETGFLFAIDEAGVIHYWTGGEKSPGVRSVEADANMIFNNRLIKKNGEIAHLDISEDTNYELKISGPEYLGFSEGCGMWIFDIYTRKALGLDKDGSVIMGKYIFNRGDKTPKVEDQIPIGEFKVNLDYFKK